MSKTIFATLTIVLLFANGCASQQSDKDRMYKEVEKLISLLKENKPKQVFEMTYPVDRDNRIVPLENKLHEIEEISKLLNRCGVPTKDKWIYTYEPDNVLQRFRFRIPLSIQSDSSSKYKTASLQISFPPPEISNKIFEYVLDAEYDHTKLKPTIPAHTNVENEGK